MAFSGADYARPERYRAERDHIWTCVESLIDDGKLKTVPQVTNSDGELEFNDALSYKRLRERQKAFTLSLPNGYEKEISLLLGKYPRLLGRNLNYSREPADPYIVISARFYGYKVMTEERHYRDRTGKNKGKKTSIADVCDAEGMDWCYLDDFLRGAGIIP